MNLNFVSKGCNLYGDFKINAIYLELPLMAGARLNTANGFDVLLKAGPYFAYGVGGKTKLSLGGLSSSGDTFGDDMLKKFDAGLGCGVGLEFSKIIVGIDGHLGLTKVSREKDIAPKNISAFLTLGYKF